MTTYMLQCMDRVVFWSLIRGYPIGQILMPGRDEGKMLRSTHPQFIPGTNQLLICTNDIENNSEGGSMIYTVEGFAKGHESYQFQS